MTAAISLAAVLALHPVTEGYNGRFDYARHIDTACEKYGLDPLDVMAVILVESSGDPQRMNSRSRATGLMGIMPSDAPEDVAHFFKGRPTSVELKDPATNLEWGCKILAGLLTRHGDLKMALYNYSGGKRWPSFEQYEDVYCAKFKIFRDALGELEQACWRLDIC